MKGWKKIAAVALSAILAAGCSSDVPVSSPTETEAPTVTENEASTVTETEAPTVTETEAPTETEAADAPEEKEIGPVFSGVTVENADMSVNHLNNKDRWECSFFCTDGDGNIYYTNLAENGYLYRYNENENVPVAKIRAGRPICHAGKVYFLSSDRKFDLNFRGQLYEYDAASGEVSLLDDREIGYVNAYEDGIFFTVANKEVAYVSYAAYFMKYGEEPKRCYPISLRYGNYGVLDDGLCPFPVDLQEEQRECAVPFDTGMNSFALNVCVYRDMLCYWSRESGALVLLNLKDGSRYSITGEELSAAARAKWNDPEYRTDIFDYTILGDTVYIANDSNSLFSWNYKSGEIEMFSDTHARGELMYLYTDGRDLYAMRGSLVTPTGLVRIEFTETDGHREIVAKELSA